jgi:cytochrome d ubiquinol oxidase subunit II
LKTEGRLRDWAYRRITPLLLGGLGFLALAFVFALVSDYQVMHRWLESPWLLVFPAIGAGACYVLWRGLGERCDWKPFAMTAVIFLAAFATLVGSFWPYMLPFTITVEAAASPTESLEFMLYAGVIALPITLIYTIVVYWIFRGKVQVSSSY